MSKKSMGFTVDATSLHAWVRELNQRTFGAPAHPSPNCTAFLHVATVPITDGENKILLRSRSYFASGATLVPSDLLCYPM